MEIYLWWASAWYSGDLPQIHLSVENTAVDEMVCNCATVLFGLCTIVWLNTYIDHSLCNCSDGLFSLKDER